MFYSRTSFTYRFIYRALIHPRGLKEEKNCVILRFDGCPRSEKRNIVFFVTLKNCVHGCIHGRIEKLEPIIPTFRSSFCKPNDSARNLIKIRSPLRLLFLLISSHPTHAASNPDLQLRPDRASNLNFNRYHRACSFINENATQLDSTLKIYTIAPVYP